LATILRIWEEMDGILNISRDGYQFTFRKEIESFGFIVWKYLNGI
jgi:hypothetical protein